MAKEYQNKKYDGQNRCRRCDRPLSNPNDIYGWRCAQIVGIDKYNEIASILDETAFKEYVTYVETYLSDDTKESDKGLMTLSYNNSAEPTAISSEILNTGYDADGVWHNWDAEKFGDDSPVYKMLSGLNTAYERANTYGRWSGDKERIADLAATLKVTDSNITDVIVMNNRQGAIRNGHNAVLLLNPSGQGFYFSYSGANKMSLESVVGL